LCFIVRPPQIRFRALHCLIDVVRDIVSGHGSQVLALPDHVEETDGWDEGERVTHTRSSEISDLPCIVIWPCDIQAYLDHKGMVQVVNYILDDASIPPSEKPLVLTHLFCRTSREFWLTRFRLGSG